MPFKYIARQQTTEVTFSTRLLRIQQNFGGKFHVASLCGCHFPSSGLWTFWLVLILLPGKESKCFLMSLFVSHPTQKSEQRFGICTKFSIFYKKIFTTLRLFALVTHCQALPCAQYRAKPPTHMHARTHTHTVFTCQFYLPQKEFVFFSPLVERKKLQLLDSSKN